MADDRADWTERDAAVLWHGFTQMADYAGMEPIIVERGEGRELVDIDGVRYLDAISSLWVTTLGHRVPELDEALVAQAGRIAHSTLLGNSNRVVIEFAEALCAVAPVRHAHVLFASDGASAVEQALKMAFQYWVNRGEGGHDRFLALGAAYHGDTIGALSLGDSGFGTGIFDALRFPVLRTPGYASENWLEAAKAAIAEHRERLAAVVIEPLVQAASGMLVADPGEVGELGRWCRSQGVLLIADEVATGFGRTGALFASQLCGLEPDLLCLGKGITGGYLPMSATLASGAVYEAFCGEPRRTFAHGHSYSGNALGAAVGLAHLRVFASSGVLDNVRQRAAQLHQALEARLAGHERVVALRQVGLLAAVELDGAPGRRLPGDGLSLAQALCVAAVRRGVLLRPLGDVVPLVPPLTITAEEIERLVSVLVAALDDARQSPPWD